MLHLSFGLLRVRRPLGSTLFPYTTLFRSRIFYRNSVDGGFLIPFESFEDLSKEVETGDERSEEHTSELQSRGHLVCRLLLEKKKTSISKRVIHSMHNGSTALPIAETTQTR